MSHARQSSPGPAIAPVSDELRIRRIDEANEERTRNLSPTPEYGWERTAQRERDLRLRIVELERMLNEVTDELVDTKENLEKATKTIAQLKRKRA